MTYAVDHPPGPRLGLVVLSSDETLEDEARAIMGAGLSLFHTRIECDPDVTPQTLAQMEARMVAAARLLPEGLDAIGYGCTSASVVIGPDAVAAQMHKAHPGVPVTNPISAVVAGLHALGARKIGLVTPYLPEVVAPMRAFLEARGIEVLAEKSFSERDDRKVARIAERSTLDAMRAAAVDGVDAVFSSCTNLRSFGIIETAEADLGLPVISSNSALLWHVARLGGLAHVKGPGRLFET
ncbi:MAG: aspartate/glutamate racemase family protein [Pseudomonadota bacterium]